MDKETRNAIERTTQRARKLLEDDFALQLEGTFDVLRTGAVAAKGGAHLSARQAFQRDKIVAAIEHKRAVRMTSAEAVKDYLRDAAFTTLNRFVALKMLEARELVQESITKGEQSTGYREFCGMAPGVALLPNAAGYRLYIESLFDELSTEIKVLFDRLDAASVLWPKRQTFEALLEIFNTAELSGVWGEDETIGWVYQFFNGGDERRRMREESQAPRNSRELAVRNQFFTPRYVVQFLTDNTLGRLWLGMYGEKTRLAECCEYLVRPLDELAETRTRKDPRDLRILDPACGSGHFLLYCFDLLLTIYDEAWESGESRIKSQSTGRSLREDYPDLAALHRELPSLIVEHNLYGVDIDPRCAQIAALGLWLRAQRAWKDFRISVSERPRIKHTHIVVAEPMPGDAVLVEEFAARLDPPLLRDLFKKMVAEMRLAGELGPLLRVEEAIATELRCAREQFVKQRQSPSFLPGMEPVTKQGELDLSGIDDDDFFHEAEDFIHKALRGFAESTSNGVNVRRRLFAGDATQGVALIDLVRTRFDVVLMNPPFGLPAPASKAHLRQLFPDAWTDLFNTFLTRAQELSVKTGALIGAIVPDRLLVTKKSSGTRKRLLNTTAISSLVYLGPEVMDRAAVNAVMLTTATGGRTISVLTYVMKGPVEERPGKLLQWVTTPDPPVNFSTVGVVPGSPFILSQPDSSIDLWERAARLEPDFAIVATGAKTFDDFRFLRTWWEVPEASLAVRWFPIDVGGDYKPGFSSPKLVQNWHANGREIRAKSVSERRTEAQVIQSSKYWFRPSLSYPYTSSVGFGPRLFFADTIISTDSVAIVPHDLTDRNWLLGVLLSSWTDTALATFGKGRKTENSSVKSLPITKPAGAEALGEAACRLIQIAFQVELGQETSRVFQKPLTCVSQSFGEELEHVAHDIDNLSCSAYGKTVPPTDIPVLIKRSKHWLPSNSISQSQVVSHLVGIVLGRWMIPSGDKSSLGFDPDSQLNLLPPSRKLGQRVTEQIIAVDDRGHESDIIMLICKQTEDLLTSGSVRPQILECLTTKDEDAIRKFVAREFFTAHVKAYSSGGRSAPIYWQLTTPSSSYSVWLYIHAFTKDTFYKALNEYAAPKLAHEERILDSLRVEQSMNSKASERSQILEKESFVEELRTFVDEVKRVAPLWNPTLDDGVVLTMAPLWRLVPQNKSWQKELKSKWDELSAGKYDWAHLAMHLWPERVVPKCASDRSLAIAHELEEVFWVEDSEGKWQPRSTPSRSVDELIRQRTSPAVKAALKALLEASVVTSGNPRGRARRTGAVAAHEGTR